MRAVQTFAILICLLILSSAIFGQGNLVQTFPDGMVDWRAMTIRTIGIGAPDPELSPAKYRVSAVNAARLDAKNKLLSILKNLNFDSNTALESLLNESEIMTNQVENAIGDFKTIGRPRLMADSSTEITVEFPLTGDVMNAILPPTGSATAVLMSEPPISRPDKSYTSLIIDCRGLELTCAIAPRVLDENGDEVFGLNWIDRQAAIDRGLVEYVDNENEPSSRAGDNPCRVTGIRISGKNKCDVVIGADEGILFKSTLENLDNLYQGRVIFLVD